MREHAGREGLAMRDAESRRLSFQTIQTASVFVLLLALCVFSSVRIDTFLTWRNVVDNLLTNAAYVGVIACGMTLVMIGGGFDLSVASITAVCSVVFVLTLQSLAGWGAYAALPAALALTLLAGGALGAVNGGLIAYIGVNPFVVTLSTMLVFRGLALVITHGGQTIEAPASFRDIVHQFYWGHVSLPGLSGYHVTIPILVFVGIFAVLFVLLRYTRYGHYLYAVGGNETVSWLAGVNTSAVKSVTYLLSGITCAVAAVLCTGMSKTAQAASYQGLEMVVIASVIVGGTPLGGGQGGLWYTLNGLLVLSVIENLLTQFGITEEYRNIVRGLIILVVVAIDVTVRRTNAKTRGQG
jgi:ribose/xylose/arabinose/galactoside ABC-type transport system permease subunit